MSDVRIVKSTRQVIERKLLATLDDSAKVAILADKDDLDLLVRGIDLLPERRARDFAKDLRKLQEAAFGSE